MAYPDHGDCDPKGPRCGKCDACAQTEVGDEARYRRIKALYEATR
jgi:hypothetical protein